MSDPIERLLAETEMADDTRLRDYLVELHAVGTSVRPVPSPELDAMMTSPAKRSAAHRHRIIITTLVVVGTVGAGVTAAAASPEVRAATDGIIEAVVAVFVPETPETTEQDVGGAPGRSPSPDPGEAPTTTDSSPPDHPGAPDHSGRGDHPGAGGSNAGAGNSGSAPHSEESHPGKGPSAPPTPPTRGGGPPPRR